MLEGFSNVDKVCWKWQEYYASVTASVKPYRSEFDISDSVRVEK